MFRNWIQKWLGTSNNQPGARSFRAHLSVLGLEERVVPAILYVDPLISATPGSTATFNAGRGGEVAGLTVGADAFTTLESAVSTAAAGDTIVLATATINTSVDFTINKTLTIVGSGIGNTVLNPNASTADDFGTSAAWFKVVGGATVNFSAATFDGLASSFGVGEAIRYEGSSGTVDGVTFTGISRTLTGNQYEGVAVVANASVVTVTNSTFTNVGRGGAVFTEAGTVGTFSGNTYTGKGVGDQIDIGVQVSFGANAVISGNTFTAASGVSSVDQSSSTAVLITDPGTVVSAFGNTFDTNRVGVIVGFGANDTPSVTLNFNNFVNNDLAISTDVLPGSQVDATQNFFGTTTGPTAAQNPSGTGDGILDANGPTLIGPFLRRETPVVSAVSGPSYITEISQPQVYAVGAGLGGAPRVSVFRNGAVIADFFAYGTSFTGGVRVAVGDVLGNGQTQVVTAAGFGGGSHVKVFDLAGNELRSFFAYEPNFTGGVFVAVGDVDGDGVDEIITGAGFGGGPHVKVFDGRTDALKASFFAYDASYSGGVTVAAGDMNFDLVDDIVTGSAASFAHVKVFNGLTSSLEQSFFAFNPDTFTQGIFVGAGVTAGTSQAQIFASFTNGPAVTGVFTPTGGQVNAIDTNSAGGNRVSGVDLTGTGRQVLLVGSGQGQASSIKVIDPTTGTELFSDNPFQVTLPGGVFVG